MLFAALQQMCGKFRIVMFAMDPNTVRRSQGHVDTGTVFGGSPARMSESHGLTVHGRYDKSTRVEMRSRQDAQLEERRSHRLSRRAVRRLAPPDLGEVGRVSVVKSTKLVHDLTHSPVAGRMTDMASRKTDLLCARY